MDFIKKDKFIRDKGKIRFCDSNIAKMSVFEYIKFQLFQQEFLQYATEQTLSDLWSGIKETSVAILNIFYIIIFPVTLTIQGYLVTKRAKVKVREQEERRNSH